MIGSHSEKWFVSLRLGYRSGYYAFCRCICTTEAQYQPFLDVVGVALQKVTSAESVVVLGDFKCTIHNTDDKT